MAGTQSESVLLVRAGARVCALPIAAVVETMRPLPVASLSGVPSWVAGVARVRGEPVPVVHLGVLLGDPAPTAPERLVTVRAGGRIAALAVDGVFGVAALDRAEATRLPLVADACAGALEALGARDEDLVLVLRAARLVPEDVELVAARSGP